jgi:general secretion pathway protein G
MKKKNRKMKNHHADRRQWGFSLVELIAVVAIIAILTAAVLPMSKMTVIRGNELELKQNLRTLRRAIDAYKKLADEKKIEVDPDASGYPETLEVLVEGVELKEGNRKVKLLRRIPIDPMTGEREWGLRGSEEEPDSFNWNGEDVFDVYTLSERKALDGTFYREW